jgi:origin recognition complex subunit 1
MTLSNPHLVYSRIYQAITKKTMNPSTAAILLDDHFKKSNEKKRASQPMRVLLIDELDALMTKKQTLLYNLFDWPGKPKSKFLIIAIANTMDLPERFKGNIKSRLGQNRIVYRPYSTSQITEILTSRVHDFGLFKFDALKIVSSRIAGINGDIRRALQVCRRAVENVKGKFYEKHPDKKERKTILEKKEFLQIKIPDSITAFE